MTNETLYLTRQMAKMLNLSERTIYRYLQSDPPMIQEPTIRDGQVRLWTRNEIETASVIIETHLRKTPGQPLARRIGNFAPSLLTAVDDFLTTREVAAILHLHIETVKLLTRPEAESLYGARLQPVVGGKGHGHEFKFDPQEVLRFLNVIEAGKELHVERQTESIVP